MSSGQGAIPYRWLQPTSLPSTVLAGQIRCDSEADSYSLDERGQGRPFAAPVFSLALQYLQGFFFCILQVHRAARPKAFVTISIKRIGERVT